MSGCQDCFEDVAVDTEDVRHCAVCFAVIPRDARVRRSLEGHCYCERCGKGFFKEVDLQGLRRSLRRAPREERTPA